MVDADWSELNFTRKIKFQKNQNLLLLLLIADHVKYITYNVTKLDCKTPLVGLNSCTLGNKLTTVATIQSIILNVIKNICKPQPE